MIKMLRTRQDRIDYWEVWYDEEQKTFTVHFGQVGERGEHYVERRKSRINVQTYMESLAKKQEASGYKLLDEDLFRAVLVQYKIDGEDPDAEFDLLEQVENAMNECLGWTGNGYCDGSDYGSGTMNVFCFVLDMELALLTIRETLEQNGQLEGCVIAYMQEEKYISAYPTAGDEVRLFL